MENYYPMMMKLKGRNCTVIGGGEVATRKVQTLLQQEAIVKLISPSVTPTLEKLWQQKKIGYINKSYQRGDLKGSFLAYATTNDPETNRQCREEAYEENVLINIVDDLKESDFIVPASIQRGSLMLTVSTQGKSPMLSKKIRQQLEEIYPEDYGEILKTLGEIRERALREMDSIKARRNLFHHLVYEIVLEGRPIADIQEEMWGAYKAYHS